MTRMLVVLAATAAVLSSAAASAGGGAPRSVAVFYYAWYGTPVRDGAWQHWDQNRRSPPADIGSSYYPVRGPYSSSDPDVVRAQMREIAATGIDTVVVSWWGAGSVEDERLPLVADAAGRERLRLAIHIEPYGGRTAPSVAADIERLGFLGFRDFYVYDSSLTDDDAWAAALGPLRGVRVFANTSLVGRAVRGGFDGVYTYDVLLNGGSTFRRLCRQARAAGILCAPSVGPGFDATRATAITATRGRRDGAGYDRAWRAAAAAAPDIVTITSYNEWHEGTQIEPAGFRPPYASYEGAFGLVGPAAETAYLTRTQSWIATLRGLAPPPPPIPPVPLSFLP